MSDRSDEARDKRAGDVLGLGGVTAGDHPIQNRDTEQDAERRRRRMRDGADDMVSDTTATDATPRTSGATSIDMGAGGDGTDIER